MDMHKIHCVDLQIAKKKVYPRNNGTIGIVIYNVARRLSPTAFFSPRFRPFVTIFFNDLSQTITFAAQKNCKIQESV